MKFRYNPESLDDFPESVEVIAVEAEDGDKFEVGQTRIYMPIQKVMEHIDTIVRQRRRIARLEALLKEAYECLAAHSEAHEHPVAYTVGLWRDKLAANGIEVRK